jgi:hypothetical protein
MEQIDWEKNRSIILLNLFTLITGLLWGIDVRFFLLYYWLENLIAGVFNVIKMLTLNNDENPLLTKLFKSTYFTMHYGIFITVHLMFLFSFISYSNPRTNPIQYVIDNLQLFLINLVLLIGDYVNGYLKWRKTSIAVTIGELMFSPYRRIVVMHLTIIFGAILYTGIQSSWVFLVIMMLMKTYVEVML